MSDQLDHESGTPLYRQLTGQIEAGELQPDRPIPSETQMADEYGVARLTARRAHRELRERDLIRTV